MTELDQLVAGQRRDDKPSQDPQRFGGERVAALGKFDESRLSTDDMPARAGNADQEDGAGPPRGTWRMNRVFPLHRPRTGQERDALSRAVEPFLKDLTIPQMDAVRLVVFGRLSLRQAAEVLGIRHPSLFERLQNASKRLRPAIEQRSGSEGLEFPPTRPLDETDTCRLRPRDDHSHRCDGHFAPAVCSCGTVLPRHYNAHTTCRVHSHGKTTRYEFNLAWLIGVGLQSLDGQTRRARRPVRGRPNSEGRVA